MLLKRLPMRVHSRAEPSEAPSRSTNVSKVTQYCFFSWTCLCQMCHAEIRSASIINSRWTEVTKQTSVISWDNDCDFLLKSKAQQKMEGVLLYKGSAVLLWRNDNTCCGDCSYRFTTPQSKLEIIQLNKNVLACRTIGMNLVLNSNISFVSTPILFRCFFRSISVSQLRFDCGLWRPRCWHVLLWIAGNLNNATSGTVDLSISGTDMVEGRRRNTKKEKKETRRQATSGRAGNLGFSSRSECKV